jgi:rhodanese-related sulfurtransferase
MKFRWEYIAASLGLVLAVGVALSTAGVGTMGAWEAEAVPSGAVESADIPPMGIPSIGPRELAVDMMAGAPGLTVVDVRATDESPTDRIPVAYWMPLDDDGWQSPGPFPTHRRLVLVASDDASAEAAWRRAHALGYGRASVLDGGQAAWNARYADPQEPAEEGSLSEWEDYRARKAVSLFLSGGVAALTAGAATGGAPRAAAPPPLPVRQASSGPKPAEGC